MITVFKLYLRNNTVQKGAVFLFGGAFVHVFYYLYRLVMARMLSPAEFGEVVVFLSLMFIVLVPASPLQTISAKTVAHLRVSNSVAQFRDFFRKISLFVGVGVVGIGVAMILGAQFLENILRFDSLGMVYIFTIVMGMTFFSGVTRGILEGFERFHLLSIVIFIDGLFRVLFGAAFVIFGYGALGAVGGIACAFVIAYAVSIFFLRDMLFGRTERFPFDASVVTEFFHMLIAFLFLNLLLNIDVVLVKQFFTPQEVGLFSALATLGRTVFLVGLLLSIVILPVAVRKKEHEVATLLFGSLGLYGLFVLGSVGIFFFFGTLLTNVLLGASYIQGASYLWIYGFAMGLVGATFLLSYFLMALGRFQFLFVLATGSILEILFIVQWHTSFKEVLASIFVSMVVTFVGVAFYAIRVVQKYEKPSF